MIGKNSIRISQEEFPSYHFALSLLGVANEVPHFTTRVSIPFWEKDEGFSVWDACKASSCLKMTQSAGANPPGKKVGCSQPMSCQDDKWMPSWRGERFQVIDGVLNYSFQIIEGFLAGLRHCQGPARQVFQTDAGYKITLMGNEMRADPMAEKFRKPEDRWILV
jgi:hypothetical protein